LADHSGGDGKNIVYLPVDGYPGNKHNETTVDLANPRSHFKEPLNPPEPMSSPKAPLSRNETWARPPESDSEINPYKISKRALAQPPPLQRTKRGKTIEKF